MIKAAVQARSKIMFSGESGAAVASGIKDDAATAERPTYGLVRAAMSIFFDELPPGAFRPRTVPAPWERPRLVFRVGRAAPRRHPSGGGLGWLLGP